MTDLRKAAEMALEALEIWEKMQPNTTACAVRIPAIQALRQALAQPKREWVGLTRDEVLDIEETTKHPLAFYEAIEAKLKEKNR